MKTLSCVLASVFAMLFTNMAHAVLPTLTLLNQYGEVSINKITGGSGNVIGCSNANSIVSNLTGAPAAVLCNSYALVSGHLLPTQLLTGYVAGAGTVASTDTVLAGLQKLDGNQQALQNGTLTASGANAEAVIAAGAISASKLLSTVSNVTVGTYAVTLAAPSSQDGQLKIIKAVATMTHTVTLALTNVSMSGAYTPTGTTTLTFTNAGDSAVFMAVGGKWVYLGGSAVAS